MKAVNDSYSTIRIVDDGSYGLIQLSLVSRIGVERKTKVNNNFVGLLQPAPSDLLEKLSRLLSDRIGDADEDIIIGMYKSGIVVSGSLALARQSKFCWSTPDRLASDCIEYHEPHRPEQKHYLYGLRPGDKVLIVEDEITSGKGVAGLTKKLRQHGVRVVGIASYLETLNFNGRLTIKLETGIDLVSLAQVELS